MSESYAIQALFGEGRSEFVDHVPHARAIGIECVRVDACEALLKIPYRDDLVGDPTRGVVFGGVITTLLDQAGGVATLCSLPEITTIATIDLRIDYLRAARPGADLFGRAFCYKRTRSVAFVRGSAWESDPEDPFATCIATFMLGANVTEHPLKLAAAAALAAGR